MSRIPSRPVTSLDAVAMQNTAGPMCTKGRIWGGRIFNAFQMVMVGRKLKIKNYTYLYVPRRVKNSINGTVPFPVFPRLGVVCEMSIFLFASVGTIFGEESNDTTLCRWMVVYLSEATIVDVIFEERKRVRTKMEMK